MSKVIVIGAGASGLIAAIKASEKNEVTILEKNDKAGKKLLITGNGRCNFWHDNIRCNAYYTDDESLLFKLLNYKDDVYNYLLKLGIFPKNKDGYYYPYSMQASSVKEVLVREASKRGVSIIYNADVKNIKKKDNTFLIETLNDSYFCDKVILSSGSKSYPKTGSNGFAYDLMQKFGIKINPVLPALTSLKGNDSYYKVWNGVRADAKVSLYVDNKKVYEEDGEVQLTDTGVSGICVFNLSGYASRALYRKEKVILKINFLKEISNLFEVLEKRSNDLLNHSLGEFFESMLNYKILAVIFKRCGISLNSKWEKLSKKEKELLCNMIQNFEIEITDTGSYDKAQVCTGGISLKEIKESMECTRIPNFYLTGELLDVDGICGGYNLSFAFISGFIAGSRI